MTTIWNILEPTEMRLHKVQKQKPNFWVCNDVISSFFGSETKVAHVYKVKLFGSPPCKFLEIQWSVPVMQVLTAVFMLFIVFPWNVKRFAIACVRLFLLHLHIFLPAVSGTLELKIGNPDFLNPSIRRIEARRVQLIPRYSCNNEYKNWHFYFHKIYDHQFGK